MWWVHRWQALGTAHECLCMASAASAVPALESAGICYCHMRHVGSEALGGSARHAIIAHFHVIHSATRTAYREGREAGAASVLTARGTYAAAAGTVFLFQCSVGAQ